jgi:hypothetical protein
VTAVTAFEVATESGRATDLNGMHGLQVRTRKTMTMLVLLTEDATDIRDFGMWPS